jgi:DNA polymerase
MNYDTQDWIDCRRCGLHQGRTQVVQYRGVIPAPIVFVGEAPGMAEDLTGLPFIGPAGMLLDEILEIVELELDRPLTYAVTNIVCCLPKSGGSLRQPRPSEIAACSDRLVAFLNAAQPDLIVLIGATARQTFNGIIEVSGIRCIHILHPAAILRMDENQVVAVHKAAATIINALEE